MLVLSRKKDQAIRIGDVRIVCVEIRGNNVRIGIEAAPGVKIIREELIDREPKSKEPERG